MPPVRALSYDPTQAGQAQKPSVPDVMGILQQAVAPFADAVVDGPRLEPPSGKDGRSGQVFVAVDKAKVQSAVREALMIAVAQIDPNLRIHVVVKKREAAA